MHLCDNTANARQFFVKSLFNSMEFTLDGDHISLVSMWMLFFVCGQLGSFLSVPMNDQSVFG